MVLDCALCAGGGRLLASDFPSWLKQEREARSLSMNALAAKAGVSHVTISNIESYTDGFSKNMVLKLARGMEASEADALLAAGFVPGAGRGGKGVKSLRIGDEFIIEATVGEPPLKGEVTPEIAEMLRLWLISQEKRGG